MKISVVTCIYNGERYINQYLRNVIELSDIVDQFIVVNDGSTDSTVELLKLGAIKKLSVVQKMNSGLPDSRNIGLSYARGDYVLFLDIDDTVDVATLVRALEKLSDTMPDLMYCNCRYVSDIASRSRELRVKNFLRKFHLPSVSIIRKKIFYNNFLVTPGTIIVRRDYAEKILFDPNLTIGEDWDFFVRALQTESLVKFNQVLLNYLVVDGSMGSRFSRDRVALNRLKSALVRSYAANFPNERQKNYIAHLGVVFELFDMSKETSFIGYTATTWRHYNLLRKSPKSIFYILTSFVKLLLRNKR